MCDLGGRATGWSLCKGLVSAAALWGPELVFLHALCSSEPFSSYPRLCSPFFLHRARVHPLGLRFWFCAFPTFVLTGSCVAMLCWSLRPMWLSR